MMIDVEQLLLEGIEMKAFGEKNKMANGNGSSDGIPDWVRNPQRQNYEAHAVFVTPDIAKMWLWRNTNNRKLRRYATSAHTDSMRSGHWAENGESMSFDRDGVLVDGQHRLQAIINSDHGYMATVTLGLDPDTRSTVNTGLKRSASDVLAMQGEQYTSQLAAATQTWNQYVTGTLQRAANIGPSRLNHQQIIDMLDQYPDIRDSVQHVCKQVRGLIASSDIAFLHYAIARSGESRERTDEFIDRFMDGRNLDTGNPILALRQKIINESRPGTRLNKKRVFALVLKAYKFWRKGTSSKYLKLGEGEPFPTLTPVGSDRKEGIW
jgi:hypothetical protein